MMKPKNPIMLGEFLKIKIVSLQAHCVGFGVCRQVMSKVPCLQDDIVSSCSLSSNGAWRIRSIYSGFHYIFLILVQI